MDTSLCTKWASVKEKLTFFLTAKFSLIYRKCTISMIHIFSLSFPFYSMKLIWWNSTDMQEARIIILKGTLKTFHISYVLDVMHVLFGIFVINQGHLNERLEAYKHNMKRSSK